MSARALPQWHDDWELLEFADAASSNRKPKRMKVSDGPKKASVRKAKLEKLAPIVRSKSSDE